jgi:hypothetical protein
MAKAGRKLTTALAVSAALLTARAATAADAPERATIVLHVDDFTSLLPAVLNTAEEVTRGVFARAGVRIVWLNGREKQPGLESALHLRVLLLSRAMAEQKIAADAVGDGVVGQAAKACGRAYIFSHRVIALASQNKHHLGRILGRVLAHEVGHLVLPDNSHSRTGIMFAAFDPRPNTDVTFTPEQAAAMRETVASGN